MHDSAQYFCYLSGPLCSMMLKGLDFAYTHRQMRRLYISISTSWTAHIWLSHFTKAQLCNKHCASLDVCVGGRGENWGANIDNMYICAAVIYLVSFVPDLPLLSRNPNFTLTQEDEGWTERKTNEEH